MAKLATLNYYNDYSTHCVISVNIVSGTYAVAVLNSSGDTVNVLAGATSSFIAGMADGGMVQVNVADNSDVTPTVYTSTYTNTAGTVTASETNISTTIHLIS